MSVRYTIDYFSPLSQNCNLLFKGNTKFWYGVMNSVQMNILEAFAILLQLSNRCRG